MTKILTVSSYGLSLFSFEMMKEFLNNEDIRPKNVLKVLQKNHKKYLRSINDGAWIPFLPIDSVKYIIKVNEHDIPFNDKWEERLSYSNFNINIKDRLWVTDIGEFCEFDRDAFVVQDDYSYQTLDGKMLYSGFSYKIPSGKYVVTIKGFMRKNKLEYPNANHGFLFYLERVESFEGYRDPREDDIYDFNVASMD